ncbi:MAG TPA: hypothetical protein VIX91_16610 [Candidatus Acidoferrum sp.]
MNCVGFSIHRLEIEAGDLLALYENGSRIRFLQADDELELHALAGAAASEHRQSFATLHGQINSVQDDLDAKGLVQTSQHHRWSRVLTAGTVRHRGIGQNHEERRHDDRTRRGNSNSCGATLRAHPLEAADHSDDQPEDGSAESWRKKVAEVSACETAMDEFGKGNGIDQSIREPAK